MVIIDKDLYRKEFPPLMKESHKTNVLIDFKLVSIDNFDETEMTFSIKFKVELKWFVQYHLLGKVLMFYVNLIIITILIYLKV